MSGVDTDLGFDYLARKNFIQKFITLDGFVFGVNRKRRAFNISRTKLGEKPNFLRSILILLFKYYKNINVLSHPHTIALNYNQWVENIAIFL